MGKSEAAAAEGREILEVSSQAGKAERIARRLLQTNKVQEETMKTSQRLWERTGGPNQESKDGELQVSGL